MRSEILESAIEYLIWIVEAGILAYGGYTLLIGLAGFRRRVPFPGASRGARFELLVPAHNEERVIGLLLENLERFDYPRGLSDVYVIADRCTDRTEAIATRAGATLLVRHGDERGKGRVLAEAMSRVGLATWETPYDALVIFDADNLVDAAFLRVMNNRIVHGQDLIQASVDAKNPEGLWVSATFAMTFWANNRFNQWQCSRVLIGAQGDGDAYHDAVAPAAPLEGRESHRGSGVLRLRHARPRWR